MVSERPIVASRLPCITEILEHGHNAWLVEPGKPEALAEGIRIVLGQKDLGGALALRARDVVNQFSWQSRAESVLRLVS
jgi:glycosyltransferase involved in cell wall biosynthesis